MVLCTPPSSAAFLFGIDDISSEREKPQMDMGNLVIRPNNDTPEHLSLYHIIVQCHITGNNVSVPNFVLGSTPLVTPTKSATRKSH